MNARVTLLAATALATAFGSTATAQTEIQFWHAMGGALGEKVEEIAAGFNESQDDFRVVPTYKGNYTENMTAAIAAFRAGEQPHIVQVFEVGTATMMAAEGAVTPVHELMAEAEADWNPDAYLPAVKSYYTTPGGELLSLPFNSSTPVLWYNADLLESAGVNVPTTWEEMFEVADALQANGHDCAFSFGWQSWVMIENYLAWHDAPIGTMANGFEGLGTELVIDEAGHLAALLQRIADSQEQGTFKYGGRRGDSLPLFTSGECAMWMNSSAYYASISEQAEFEFGQAFLPLNTAVAEEPQNSIIGGATLWVLGGHDGAEYEGVARFFNYLSTPEVQADWHQSTGYVPITTAAYELSQEQGFYGNPISALDLENTTAAEVRKIISEELPEADVARLSVPEVFAFASAYGKMHVGEGNPGTDTAIQQLSLNQPTENSRGLRFGNFVQIRDIINEELEDLWAGNQSAEEALKNAAERGNELLREFERSNS